MNKTDHCARTAWKSSVYDAIPKSVFATMAAAFAIRLEPHTQGLNCVVEELDRLHAESLITPKQYRNAIQALQAAHP